MSKGMGRVFFRIIISCAFLLCTVLNAPPADAQEKARQDADMYTSSTGESLDVYDPIEPVNRGIFWFNDKADIYVLGPVARGYDYVMPEFAQTGIGNFFTNLTWPIKLVADVIELDFSQAGKDTSRFVINSTIGIVGLIDVAKEIGIEHNRSDIGIALGRDGVAAGPYLVIPFLGPSNLRDAAGLGAAVFVTPTAIMAYAGVDDDVTLWVTVGTRALEFIDTRAKLEDVIKTARESSIDYYLFMQGAYTQYRNGLIRQKTGKEMLKDETAGKSPRHLLDDEDEKL